MITFAMVMATMSRNSSQTRFSVSLLAKAMPMPSMNAKISAVMTDISGGISIVK